MLEVLKMDMANFTIQQIRPFVQQQSVDYEKKKFDELLKQQEGIGSAVARVMDSHSCAWDSSPSQGNHIYVML